MPTRLSAGPLQVTSLDLTSVNYMLQQVRRELDEIKGLRGKVTIHSNVSITGTLVLTGTANTVFAFDSAGTSTYLEETGTGKAVLQTSPTILTPTIASFVNATHSHQNSAGGGTLDHGLALTGLADDDHSAYLLASSATSRAFFASSWIDLTDGGATTLHSHGGGVTDHGALTGLTDDDHTQYALLVGRSGGQVLIGGTGVDDDITLKPTSGVGSTSSNLFLAVGSNGSIPGLRINSLGKVGIGSNANHGSQLYIPNQTAAEIALQIEGAASQSAQLQVWQDSGGNTVSEVSSLGVLATYPTLGGGIGIGTSTMSTAAFHSVATNTRQFLFNRTEIGTGSGDGTYFQCNDVGQFAIVNQETTSDGLLRFATGGDFHFYMDYVGNFIIDDAQSTPGAGTKGLVFGDGTALSSMASNTAGLYANDVGGTVKMHAIDEAGAGGMIVTGVGTAGRVAFWDGASSLSSDADFTFSTDTLSIDNITLPTPSSTEAIIRAGSSTLLHAFGTDSVFVGVAAGNLTQSVGYNTGVGQEVLKSLTSGDSNVGMGRWALKAATTGSSNIGIGLDALTALTTGVSNIGIGEGSLRTITTGGSNIAIGRGTGGSLSTSGSNMIAIGLSALALLSSGVFCVAIGTSALGTIATSGYSTAIGHEALKIATGDENTALGYTAGNTVTSGSGNICIGSSSDVSGGTIARGIAIGTDCIVGSSNYMQLGDAAICVGIAGAAKPTTGTKGLIFGDGTALSTMASNTAGIYADDVGGVVNLFAINEADVVTQLTGGFNGTVNPVVSITVVNGQVTAVS